MNYCKDCEYLRITSIPREEKIPPYVPGEEREYTGDFVCGLLSNYMGSYLGDEIKESMEALNIACPDCHEPVGCIFLIEQQDRFGCNLFKKKETK